VLLAEIIIVHIIMSTQVQQSFPESKTPDKHHAAHPLCALSADEILYTAELIRSIWPANTDIRFKSITLEEPPKAQVLPYLEAEAAGRQLPNLDRKAFTSYYIRNTVGPCSSAALTSARIFEGWRRIVHAVHIRLLSRV